MSIRRLRSIIASASYLSPTEKQRLLAKANALRLSRERGTGR